MQESKCSNCTKFIKQADREGFSLCREWELLKNGIVKEALHEREVATCERKKKAKREKTFEELMAEAYAERTAKRRGRA